MHILPIQHTCLCLFWMGESISVLSRDWNNMCMILCCVLAYVIHALNILDMGGSEVASFLRDLFTL